MGVTENCWAIHWGKIIAWGTWRRFQKKKKEKEKQVIDVAAAAVEEEEEIFFNLREVEAAT